MEIPSGFDIVFYDKGWENLVATWLVFFKYSENIPRMIPKSKFGSIDIKRKNVLCTGFDPSLETPDWKTNFEDASFFAILYTNNLNFDKVQTITDTVRPIYQLAYDWLFPNQPISFDWLSQYRDVFDAFSYLDTHWESLEEKLIKNTENTKSELQSLREYKQLFEERIVKSVRIHKVLTLTGKPALLSFCPEEYVCGTKIRDFLNASVNVDKSSFLINMFRYDLEHHTWHFEIFPLENCDSDMNDVSKNVFRDDSGRTMFSLFGDKKEYICDYFKFIEMYQNGDYIGELEDSADIIDEFLHRFVVRIARKAVSAKVYSSSFVKFALTLPPPPLLRERVKNFILKEWNETVSFWDYNETENRWKIDIFEEQIVAPQDIVAGTTTKTSVFDKEIKTYSFEGRPKERLIRYNPSFSK